MSAAQGFDRPALPVRHGQNMSAPHVRVLQVCTSRAGRRHPAANGLVRAQDCLNPVTNRAYIHKQQSLYHRSHWLVGEPGANEEPAVMAALSGFGTGNELALRATSLFSGARRGNCAGHLPEVASCNPIALPRDGDVITLDRKASSGAGGASEKFKRRKRDWAPRETQLGSGTDWMFAQQVEVALEAAPETCGKGAKECHADIWG